MNVAPEPRPLHRTADLPSGTAPSTRPQGTGTTAATGAAHHYPPDTLATETRPHSNGPARQAPTTRTFAPGDRIFTPRTGAGLVYIVRSGCVRLAKALPGGRSISVGLLGPNTIFSQEDTSDGIASGATAEALVSSTLSVIEVSDLAALIAESPELTGAMVAGMTRRMTELQTLIEHILARDASIRLATTLLALAERFGQPVEAGMTALMLPLTHQALANMIGSNRVTVTRKLLEFQATGLARATGRNQLAVNPAGLRACVASSAAMSGKGQPS